jgi:hypothetical protein
MEQSFVTSTGSLYGGISRQPPPLRFPNQIADSLNTLFSVVNGARKRPGTELVAPIADLDADGNYRLHAINRDDGYHIIYGEQTIKAFDGFGVALPITFGADAQTYYQAESADADDIRIISIRDYSFILNTSVRLNTKRSDDYVVTRDHRDYDTLLSHTPADGTSHRTKGDTVTEAAGYYSYDVGGVTFPTFRAGNTNATGGNPATYDSSSVGYSVITFRFVRPGGGVEAFTATIDVRDAPPASMHD